MFERKVNSIFAPSSLWLFALITLILACGLGVRLYDLKDPPLDYAVARQLRSAFIARGKYYQIAQDVPEWKRDIALTQGRHSMIEPTVMETLVAGTYWVVGGEYVWIARIYSALFWVLGGVAVFALARDMAGVDGAVVGLTYYLFVPFGLVSSRSFQPDPLMTASIIYAWWTFHSWYRRHTWRWAIAAGVSAGVAMFVKSTAVFFLLGGMGVLVLVDRRIRKLIKDVQMWVILALSGIPVILYHLYGVFIVGELAQQFRGRFFPQLLSSPQFYRQLVNAISTVVAHEFILLIGLIGVILLPKKEDIAYVLGIGAGYLIYVLAFSYHSTTHYYYHLPIIPWVAISIASFSKFLFERMNNKFLHHAFRLGLLVILLFGVGGGHYMLYKEDYRHEPSWYKQVASKVNREAKIAVLSQDYGSRISYFGWITPKVWLGTGDQEHSALVGGEQNPFEREFRQFTEGVDYFIVTWFNELERQEKLHDQLYGTYQIHDEGGGYVIFDLNEKISQ